MALYVCMFRVQNRKKKKNMGSDCLPKVVIPMKTALHYAIAQIQDYLNKVDFYNVILFYKKSHLNVFRFFFCHVTKCEKFKVY